MKKNARLADIYIKIYNKKPLMMNDLEFLYMYDPECFEKTCKNLFYKEPETKKLIQPENETKKEAENLSQTESMAKDVSRVYEQQGRDEKLFNREKIEVLLENLKKMDESASALQTVSAEKVKELLGSLYMEMLFPHNDREKYFQFDGSDNESTFNKKA